MTGETKQIKFRKGFKNQLMEDMILYSSVTPDKPIITDFYEIHSTGTIIGRKGYAWDGASGPTVDTKSAVRGSLGHDIVYQAMREGFLDWKWKEEIDEEFYRWIREDGMWRWRARLWLRAVQKHGGKEKCDPYRIYTAP